jgi:uracil-DNA glycosylase
MDADEPKTLGRAEVRGARLQRVWDAHVAPLNRLVEEIRKERGSGFAVPYFDPADGGVQAECLYVMEAPGARAVRTGFVSRNNPDETARNVCVLSAEAGLPRALTAIWNIVPWYIGDESSIRAATGVDIVGGWPYLQRVLELLPRMKVAVLLGRKAQRITRRLTIERPEIMIVASPHPSPLVVNRRPENRAVILNKLREAAGLIAVGKSSAPGAA